MSHFSPSPLADDKFLKMLREQLAFGSFGGRASVVHWAWVLGCGLVVRKATSGGEQPSGKRGFGGEQVFQAEGTV